MSSYSFYDVLLRWTWCGWTDIVATETRPDEQLPFFHLRDWTNRWIYSSLNHLSDGCKYRWYSITIRTSLAKKIAVFWPQFGRYTSSAALSFFSDLCTTNQQWMICLILSIQHQMGIASIWLNTANAGHTVTTEWALRGSHVCKSHDEGNAPNPLLLCSISMKLNGYSRYILQTIRRGWMDSEWGWWRCCCFPSWLNMQNRFCSLCVL